MPVKQQFVCLVPGCGKRCGNSGTYKNHLVSGKKSKILRFTRKSYRTFQKDDATRYQTQLRKTVGGETTVIDAKGGPTSYMNSGFAKS